MATTDPNLAKGSLASVIVDSSLAAEMDPLIGLNLGGYVVTKLLAEGGMGLVYEAKHETLGRRAAVKVLKPEVARNAQWAQRFLTEARAIASLNHRNIVELLNFGQTPQGRQYMMMAFLEGESLEHHIAVSAPVAPAVALGVVEQVLNGLAEAHKKGVVHRDLKPSNVVLLREHSGELLVKILDFGLARQDPVPLAREVEVRSKPGASLLAGTPEYMAPEQAQGHAVDQAADLYSLGVMLFELLTGSRPFAAATVEALQQKHLTEAAPLVSSLVSNLPEGVDELVQSFLEKDPNRRPQSADQARQMVNRLLRRMSFDATAVRSDGELPGSGSLERVSGSSAGATTERVLPASKRRQRRRALAVAALLGFALAIVLVWWRWLPSGEPARLPGVAPPEAAASAAARPQPPEARETAPAPANLPPVAPVVAAPAEEMAPRPAPRGSAHREPRRAVVVPPPPCTPDARWREAMRLTLADLSRFGDRAAYQAAEGRISSLILDARTPGECAQVQSELDQLKQMLGLSTD